jgi:SAM-dependent methyltransferase
MQYDRIKKTLGNVFNRKPFLRILFYKLLDLLLLRTWHIKAEIRKWSETGKKSNLSILDAGSGFGQYTYFLSQKFKEWNILGVDVKEDQIADCSAFFSRIGKRNVRFETGDLILFNDSGRFDLILAVDVMEHISEDVQVFRNFYQSLKAGGMVLISTPSDQGGSDVHGHSDESFIDEHVRDGYSISEITDKLKMAGFTTAEARYSYGTPGKISWRLSMKYPIIMLNMSRFLFMVLPLYYLIVFPFALILNMLDVKLKHGSGTGLIVKAWK